MISVKNYLNDYYSRRGYSALASNESGTMAGSAISILVLLVTLMLCALLFGTLQGQTGDKIAELNDANATSSFNSIAATGWGSIDLFGMIPYVAVFIVLLSMLMGLTRDS